MLAIVVDGCVKGVGMCVGVGDWVAILLFCSEVYILYNEPLLRGHAALSSLHQVRGRKERRRKEEER